MEKHSKDLQPDDSGESKHVRRDGRIGFTPALAAQVRLFPGRSTDKGAVEYVNGNRRVTVTARMAGELPAGKMPRLILLWLTGEIQRHSAEVDAATRTVYAGSSFRGFLKRLGLSYGSTTQRRVREQLKRLATTSIQFEEWSGEVDKSNKVRGGGFLIADAWQVEFESPDGQDDSMFPNFITLSQGMWDQLKDYPVPIDLNMIAELGKSALALDVYSWATYRVNRLKQPIHMTWQQLYDQFNAGETAAMTLFRQRFRAAVADVVRVYPDLHIDVSSSKQVVLYPSVPSILSRELKGVKPAEGRHDNADGVVSRVDAWFTVPTERGDGRVFGSLQAFSSAQAQQHLCGVVPLGRACPVCAYNPENEPLHGSCAGAAGEGE